MESKGSAAKERYLGDYEELAAAASMAARALIFDEKDQRLESYLECEYMTLRFHLYSESNTSGVAHVASSYYFKLWNVDPQHAYIGTFKTLAILTPQLNVAYERGKRRLSRWLKSNISSLGIDDFDSQRERGYNVLIPDSLPSDVTEMHRQLLRSMPKKISTCVSFLESVAPGLLILMTPDFLRFALKPTFAFGSLATGDRFLILTSLGPEERLRYKGHIQDHFKGGNYLLPLFQVLSGEDNGPWSRSLSGGTLKKHQEIIYRMVRKGSSFNSTASQTSSDTDSSSYSTLSSTDLLKSWSSGDNVVKVASSETVALFPEMHFRVPRITFRVPSFSTRPEDVNNNIGDKVDVQRSSG